MESKNPIQVADRLFLAMETLSKIGPVSLADLSRELNLNKSTTHRLLSSLIYMGYAKQDSETQKYDLSLKVLALSNCLLERLDILEVVRPYLKSLSQETGETVHFVQLDGSEAVYIYKEESRQNSVRIPLYCSGVGKAMAAGMEESQIHKLWDACTHKKLTRHTITDYDTFLKEVKEARKNGYALDNEENELGVRCIAVGLTDYKGRSRYAFSISAPVTRMTDKRIQEIIPLVLQVKKEIEQGA